MNQIRPNAKGFKRAHHTAATLSAVILRSLDASPHALTSADLAVAHGVTPARVRAALFGLIAVGLALDVGGVCLSGSGLARTYRSVGHALPVEATVAQPTSKDAIMAVLRAGPEKTPQIARRAGLANQTVQATLRKMEAARMVVADSFGRGGVITWRLA